MVGCKEGGIYIVFVRKIVPNNIETQTSEAVNSWLIVNNFPAR